MYTALDVETFPIAQGVLDPKIVCCSFSDPAIVLGNSKEENLESKLKEVLDSRYIIGHNIAFDMACIMRSYPDLTHCIFRAYKEKRVHDTFIREKLINLGTHGDIDTLGGKRIVYSLAGLAMSRLGTDISDMKENNVRTSYDGLDGVKAKHYPLSYYNYSLQDALITHKVFNDQYCSLVDLNKEEVLEVEWLHVNAAFVLYLMSVRGLKVDVRRKQEIQDEVEASLDPKNLPLLYSSGIITPGHSGVPYKRNPQKKTKPQPEKVNVKSHLIPHIEGVAEANGIDVEYTATGRVSASSGFIAKLAPFDPVLNQYKTRASLIKLKTSYFPAMEFPFASGFTAHVIHPRYDPLRRTGRVSSRGNSKTTKRALYASVNIQQVDPRIRTCYVARPGFVYLSVDYSALELVCLANTIMRIYGHSRLKDQLNAGIDPHAYLGSKLARMGYEAFLEKKTEDPEFFKYWRTLAKPIGLGYPGGMGIETMMTLCGNYGVPVSRLEAQEFKNVWLSEYPEMNLYLDHPLEEARDYTTFFGMVRANCNYTEWCNGNALQSPGAEGMKLAMFEIAKMCYSDSSLLNGCFPIAQIHDELLLELPEDDKMANRAKLVQEVMESSLSSVLTYMNRTAIKTEAVLMRAWDKKAKPVYDSDNRLSVWEPNEEVQGVL